MPNELSYEITEHLAVLSVNPNSGWQKEVNLVSWNNRDPKYDIRDWAPDHDKMGKGITLTTDEMHELAEMLRKTTSI